jgi:hypothetical protein
VAIFGMTVFTVHGVGLSSSRGSHPCRLLAEALATSEMVRAAMLGIFCCKSFSPASASFSPSTLDMPAMSVPSSVGLADDDQHTESGGESQHKQDDQHVTPP